MKSIKLLISLALSLSAALALADGPALSQSAAQLRQDLVNVGVARFTAPDYKPGIVQHIVLFRYAPTLSPTQKLDIAHRFVNLQNQCRRNGQKYILSIQTGPQNAGEGADQGLEQGFIVTFKSEGDRNYYVGQPVVMDARFYDPAHQAFKDTLAPDPRTKEPKLTSVLVFDFPLQGYSNSR